MKKVLGILCTAILTIAMLAGCSSGTAPSTSESTPASATESAGESSAVTATSDWPSQNITVHCASKAGGGTDMHTRYITNAWTKLVDTNIVVQNYDSSAVAFTTIANSKPNGYNLLAMHTGIVCSYLTGGTEVNPTEDLAVVACMEDFGVQAIIAGPDAPYDTFDEMIQYAKEHPGELSCAIATNGSTEFLWGEIEQVSGADFKMVEAANETEKLTNVAGGFISLGNCSLNNAISYETDGKIKVLGIIDDKKGVAPQYKTLASQGYNVEFPIYLYIFAPAGTDEATLEAMNASLSGVMNDQDYLDGMDALGAAANCMNLEDSRAALQSAYDTMKSVGDTLGITKVA
ncbi:MAG: tripartite tricarboxylate transporter substrate-binding protein [Oscillospiraceae bacterium]